MALTLLLGCGQHDEIARYTVPKPELVDPTLVASTTAKATPTTEQQTLGLIVPVGQMGWFFKLTGDVAAVAAQDEAFLQFVNSLKFSDGLDAKPSWSLPAGWKEMPGREMRFATIQIAADGKPLELSVIPLPFNGSDTSKYVLDNVNRWRGQLNLQPIAADELAGATKALKIGDHEATLVSLVGMGSGGMGGAPFAPFAGGKSLPPDHPPLTGAAPRSSPSSSPASAPLKFTAPAEWAPAAKNAFSLLAFKVAEGDKQADITVSSAGGDWLANVNRWRGQISLPPLSAEELTKATKKIDTLGSQGQYVELVGSETILGVRAEAGGRTWFIKLKGVVSLAEREKSRFEAFVQSLALP